MILARRLLLSNGRVRTRRGSRQRLGDTAQIDDDSLDTVAFAFNFGLETFHLVAIEGIGDILSWMLANGAQVQEWEGY